MRFLLMVVLVTAWSALCISQGLAINAGLGKAAIFLVPAVIIGWALPPGQENL